MALYLFFCEKTMRGQVKLLFVVFLMCLQDIGIRFVVISEIPKCDITVLQNNGKVWYVLILSKIS